LSLLTGGVRARLVHDSVVSVITTGLTELGWLASTIYDVPPGTRQHRPVTVWSGMQSSDEPLAPNSVVVTTEGVTTEFFELGSILTDSAASMQIDAYVENDSLGTEITNDIRDILRGRVSAAAPRGMIPVRDFRIADAPVMFCVSIYDLRVSRNPKIVEQQWIKHWFSITGDVHDAYYEAEAEQLIPFPPYPNGDLYPDDHLYPGVTGPYPQTDLYPDDDIYPGG
jgi:hypothetical protein